MYESLALYIDGEFIAGGGPREQDVHNPASGQAIGISVRDFCATLLSALGHG